MTFAHKLLLGAAALALMTGGSQAADLLVHSDPIYDSPLFNFEGFYVGGSVGLEAMSSSTAGTVGIVAGANFSVNEAILTGIEFQGDLLWDENDAALQLLLLGKLGFYLTDETLLYADLGGGLTDGTGVYAFGAGIEQALTSNISVRGEAMGIGAWGESPDVGKVAVSLIWHVN